MLNLVFKFDTMLESIFFLLRGKGLELRSALQLRGKAEAKELPFFFYLGEEGDSTYEASPLPLPSPL